MTDEQLTRLRALLRAKLKRHQRLQEMIDLLGDDGVVELVADMAEKWGDDGAIDRFRLPLLATRALLAGQPYTPPVVILCGAKTRTGAPCKRQPIPGKKRCRNHGGLSTGARTIEGKAKSLACLRLRWNR